MTIKRRLFLSNILMLMMPIITSVLALGIMALVFANITGIRDVRSSQNEDVFYEAVHLIESNMNLWSQGNDAHIDEEVNNFYEQYGRSGFSLNVYKNNVLLSFAPEVIAGSIIDIPIPQGTNNILITADDSAYYKINIGTYTAILKGHNFITFDKIRSSDYRSTVINLILLAIGLIIAVVLLTNRFLTHFVFKSITIPLDILAYGVHQIGEGNLDYRIEYNRNDEFTQVCEDFNKMALYLKNSAVESQKNEHSRKELLAGISHDLRSPLTSIKAFVEGLIDGVAATPKVQQEYLQIIKTKADDINNMVSKLFLFSKMDMGNFPYQPEKLDVGKEICEFVIASHEDYQARGLVIETKDLIHENYIYVDPMQLRSIFTNIFDNSAKYRKNDVALATVFYEIKDKTVRIIFEDNGPGVPDDALPKLFDVFYKVDQSRNDPQKGSGLGLAIAKKAVERMQGNIYAENREGGGLRLIIEIPETEGENLE